MSYIVLGVRPWDFEDENGSRVKGATVDYIDPLMLNDRDVVGYAVLNISVKPDVVPSFPSAPGIYELDFRQRKGKGGKATLVLTGAELVEELSLHDSETERRI